jgi:hypothetical protein
MSVKAIETPEQILLSPRTLWKPIMPMTYEAYLDEVTTLLTEMYELSDDEAIKLVMRVQATDFFTLHDDVPSMCTQERAVEDAKTIFAQRNKSLGHVPSKRPRKGQ